MNVLFLTIARKKDFKMTRDIINCFLNDSHKVFVVCPADEDYPPSKEYKVIDDVHYLFVSSGNIRGKIGLFEKVKNYIAIDSVYLKAIKESHIDTEIDLILYSTPPITLVKTIAWVKKNNSNAKTYLMLKDIFPQNAVDMGLIRTRGIMYFAWVYFRQKEKRLYKLSDYIGCMSEANKHYVLNHNPELTEIKVGICVNSYAYEPLLIIDKAAVRKEFGLPEDKIIFLYGGNLGKPQGLSYFVDVLRANADKEDRFFLICGRGNDQSTITDYIKAENPSNVKYMDYVPSNVFDRISRACDVGLVFLDHRFTIPNFPSRMLSIMLNAMPLLAATDINTDVGDVINDGNMGWWCESTDIIPFCHYIDQICDNPIVIKQKGSNARTYYESHYTTEIAYHQIIDVIK